MHLVAGFVALTAVLSAQEPDLRAAQRAGRALARLGAGERVQIVIRDSGVVEGSVVTASPLVVRLRADGSLIDIPVRRVDSLWVRRGNHAGEGALIGALPGVLVLGAVLVTSGGPAGEARDLRNFSGAMTGLMLLAGGVALGALIGASTPKWEQRTP